jgi:hypothetical protein
MVSSQTGDWLLTLIQIQTMNSKRKVAYCPYSGNRFALGFATFSAKHFPSGILGT